MLICRHRKKIGSAWQLLNPGQQALLVLVYLRKDETFVEIAAGFTVSAPTAWYVEETVMLLSARSPKLAQALRKAKEDGLTYVTFEGTLIHIDRVKADRPYFSGKHRVHGMNVQVIAGPDGTIVRRAAALHPRPDRRPNLGHPARVREGRLPHARDKGCQGAETTVVINPYKGRTSRSHPSCEAINKPVKADPVLKENGLIAPRFG